MRRLLPASGLAAALALGGCAQAPVAPSAPAAPGATQEAASRWSGRLGLQVDSDKPQSFSAGFELKGSAQAGELVLVSPLGSTLAVLSWSPGSATLQSEGATRSFPSLEALAQHATGTAIPIPALFDWLAGRDTPVPGWRPDLSQVAVGRLAAKRFEPQPAANLRIVLDR